MEEKNDDYTIIPTEEITDQSFLDHNDQEEELSTVPDKTIANADYSYYTEDQFANLKVDLYLDYAKQIQACPFMVSDEQRESLFSLLEQISDILPPKNIEVIFTKENEIQLFRNHQNGNSSLIFDEFGGIALSKIGKKGLGYKYDYLDADKLDKKNAYLFTKVFLGDNIC